MKKLIKRLLKSLFFVLLGVIITLNLFIILSGRFYLYKGIQHTYLSGKTGPGIYDLDIFENRIIQKGDSIINLPQHRQVDGVKLSKAQRKMLEGLQTRAFIVLKNDSVIYEEYWDTHDEATLSNSFSIAKTITAMLIGIAVEEGKIKSIDEPVANYIPEFKSNGKEKISIRHLLQMSSGLDWTESGKNPLSDNAASYYGSDLYELSTGQKLITQPGKKFIYQSGNSQLLGIIVEKATGKKLSEYASEKIWKKIGASQDAYWNLDKKDGLEKAFCCVYATARDYAKIGQMLEHGGSMNGREVLPLLYYEEMVRPAALSTEDGVPNYRYGLHIWTYIGEKNPVYYCRGIKGQYIITIPDENLVIIRIGLEREDNYTLASSKMKDLRYVERYKYKAGHSKCLFDYLEIGRNLAKQTE